MTPTELNIATVVLGGIITLIAIALGGKWIWECIVDTRDEINDIYTPEVLRERSEDKDLDEEDEETSEESNGEGSADDTEGSGSEGEDTGERQ